MRQSLSVIVLLQISLFGSIAFLRLGRSGRLGLSRNCSGCCSGKSEVQVAVRHVDLLKVRTVNGKLLDKS